MPCPWSEPRARHSSRISPVYAQSKGQQNNRSYTELYTQWYIVVCASVTLYRAREQHSLGVCQQKGVIYPVFPLSYRTYTQARVMFYIRSDYTPNNNDLVRGSQVGINLVYSKYILSILYTDILELFSSLVIYSFIIY